MLPELIRQLGLEATTPADVKVTLEEKSIPRKDNGRKNMSDLASRFGRKALMRIAKAIQAADMGPLLSMLTSGVDFTHPETVGAIDDLEQAGVLSAGEAAAFKGIGEWQESPLQDVGLTDTVSVEEVLAAQDQIAKEDVMNGTRATVSGKATAVNAWLDVYDLDGKTLAEVQVYCDSLLASADGNP